jgi:hypothetical protein
LAGRTRRIVTPEEYIKIIESYGVGFDNPCDELVINAIRHFKYVVNPWNNAALAEILVESVGFTKEECDKYFQRPTQMAIVHDVKTDIENLVEFSIKSDLGAALTLLNPGQTTNFIYKVRGLDPRLTHWRNQ